MTNHFDICINKELTAEYNALNYPFETLDEDAQLVQTKSELYGSLLKFTQVFYELRTGREFTLSHPDGRESHYISICRALKNVFAGKVSRLIINIPPRYGKTEILIHFVAWALARYPDCNFIYTSYSHTLAERQTSTIRDIINLPGYRKMFNIDLDPATTAKDDFKTNYGGNVYAAGAGGSITGIGAGIKGCKDRFSGAFLIDDIHKPDEVTSDVIRGRDNEWFFNTAQSRLNNGKQTPIIFIGQRLHEDDLPTNLIKMGGWEILSIPALDEAGNSLHPELHSVEDLLKLKEQSPYVFSAQYQQNPQPAGGGIFKPEWFSKLDIIPDILATFITVDTAETDKTYNDSTVFSFFGIYKFINQYIDTDTYALHWIDCVELKIEPKDLQSEFMQFYANCMKFHVKPSFSAIERKSTGVTLLSTLKTIPGIRAIEIERTKASGNKTTRFLEIQPFCAKSLISLPKFDKHTNMCIEHMGKITANDSHRFDDIADTLYDGIKLGLIDNIVLPMINPTRTNEDLMVKKLLARSNKIMQLRQKV